MDKKKLEIVSFLLLFGGVSLLTFFVFKPFLYIIILASVLSVLMNPLHKKLSGVLRNKSLSALIFVVLVLIFIIMPLLLIGLQIFNDTQGFFGMGGTQSHYVEVLQSGIDRIVHYFSPNFSFNINDYTSKLFQIISNNFAVLITQTAYVFFQTFFLLFTFFFFLRDGENMLSSVISLSPFEKEHTDEILGAIKKTINSVIRGTLFVGLVRLILIIGGFYIFGIPNAFLWGSIGGIIGAVPGLGTPFAIFPAALYLYLQGSIVPAIGLVIFGLLIIFFTDNLLTAYFFGKGLNISPIFVLFSLLGGIFFFGPLGFIFGPLVLSLFIAVIEMYKILLLKRAS